MNRTRHHHRFTRSLLGLLLSIPLAGVILAMAACLPVPVGDPAQSKADPAVNGVWHWRNSGNGEHMLFVAQPWDDRTHLVQSYEYKESGGAVQAQSFNINKAWFTTIAETRFIVVEPVLGLDADGVQPPDDSDRFWFVAEISVKDDAVLLNPIGGDRFKGVKSREEAERVIREAKAAGAASGYYFGDQAITLHRQSGVEGVQLLEKVRGSFRGLTGAN